MFNEIYRGDRTMSQTHPQMSEAEAVSPLLRKRWEAEDLVPLWESPNGALGPSPETPRHWQWQRLRPILLETGKISLPSIVERRVLQLLNRSSPGETTAGLMNASIQVLMPGELARAHRHSMNALRLVLDGHGAETVVNGKPCAMEVGDLVTTPAWTWHEHRHHGSTPVMWLDVLDAALYVAAGEARFEQGPIRGSVPMLDDAMFTAPTLAPVLEGSWDVDSPVFRYPWGHTQRALQAAPRGADGARRVRFVNPVTGWPCLSLIDCHVTEIEPRSPTRPFRTSASSICSVVEGEGVSRIGDVTVEWRAKDTFTIPQHTWVSHEARGGVARIFTAQNREVYRRLGLLTEQQGSPKEERT
jgi:gentisate 1,2-dioxygenase